MKGTWWRREVPVVFSITLMAVIGISTITPAFPAVIERFGIDPGQVSLLVTFYAIPGVAMAPLAGVLADLYGRRRVLLPCLLLFGIAGLGCALTGDFQTLLAMRFLQGLGAGAFSTISVTLIGDAYSGGECVQVMGYNASVLSVGTALFPMIGGILATFAWFFPFALTALGLPVGLLAWLVLPEGDGHEPVSIKAYLAKAVQVASDLDTACLLFCALMLFVLIMGPYFTFIPLVLRAEMGASAVLIGVVMSTMSFTTAMVTSRLGWLSRRIPGRVLILSSFLVLSMALAIVPLADHLWMILLTTMLVGLAQGISYPTIQVLLSMRARDDFRGALMSMNVMMLKMGQTIGPLSMAIIYDAWGIDNVFLSGSILALATLLVALMILKKEKEFFRDVDIAYAGGPLG